VEARFSAPVQTSPGAHPASCTMGTESFPGVKSGRSMTLTPHPLLVPWSRKGRAISLLPLWAVRPVQSPTACTRVHFCFTVRTNREKITERNRQLHNEYTRCCDNEVFIVCMPTYLLTYSMEQSPS
jgi:hypothetical protein